MRISTAGFYAMHPKGADLYARRYCVLESVYDENGIRFFGAKCSYFK